MATATIRYGAQDPESREQGKQQDPEKARKAGFDPCFRYLFGQVTWNMVLEKREVEDSYLIFLRINSSKLKNCPPAQMKRELLAKLSKSIKREHKRWQQRPRRNTE